MIKPRIEYSLIFGVVCTVRKGEIGHFRHSIHSERIELLYVEVVSVRLYFAVPKSYDECEICWRGALCITNGEADSILV